MADMDLDDLDVPRQSATRLGGRFAPKGSKLQPKPKPKTEPPPSKEDLDSVPPPVKEEIDCKPPLGLNHASVENAAAAMDIDVKEEDDTNTMKMEEEEEMVDEEEDHVVKEISVYFTPSIDADTKLYLMQYPLRPGWRPYDLDDRCQEVRVKPVNSDVEIDLKIDRDAKNYDCTADPKTRIPKETLSRKWIASTQAGNAIGVLVDDKLHLNPIHVVVQLRPSLEHLKPGGSKTRKNVEGTVKAEELEQEKPMGTQKTQSKMPIESTKSNKDTEEWVPLKFHGASSVISVRNLKRMMNEDSSPIQFSTSSHDYLDSLCSITSTYRPKSDVISQRSLLSFPLDERYKYWLVQGGTVHRFDALKHYLKPEESVEEMLGVLQKYAQLVQGHWVPKSSLLQFDKDQEEMCRLARDLILVQFSKSPRISYTQYPQSPQVLLNAIKNALNGLAVERPSLKDWKFKETPDTTFIKLHPKIVEEQKQGWELKENHINQFFAKRKGAGTKSSSKTKNPGNVATLKKY